ncbi:terpene synthase family protein [Streptomyces sp. NPDC001286]
MTVTLIEATPHKQIRVRIPPLYCPLETTVHPDVDKLALRSIEWMTRLGFCDENSQRSRVIGTHSSQWISRLAPHGTGDGLQIASDWVYCGFTLDDALFDLGPTNRKPDEVVPIVLRLLHVADHPETDPGPDPFMRALRDLSLRIRAVASPTVVRRWADGNAEWFLAATGMAGYRARGSAPTLAEYVTSGPRDRGAKASMALIETAEGTCLPDNVMEQRVVRAATQAAYLLVTIGNDLYSFRRESTVGIPVSNIVGVLMREHRSTPDRAAVEAVHLHDRVMVCYLALRERLMRRATPELRTYLTQLDHYVRGNHEWSHSVPRYHDEFGGTGAPDAPLWADTPSTPHLEAPPLPAIAWWWECISS